MKLFAVVVVLFNIINANASQPKPITKLDVIAKDPQGNYLEMNYYDALQFCLKQGMALPSARQFAEFAWTLGAYEILNNDSSGFERIYAINWNGETDRFYYKVWFYEPTADLAQAPSGFWSSSFSRDNTSRMWIFLGRNGSFYTHERELSLPPSYSTHSVGCIKP